MRLMPCHRYRTASGLVFMKFPPQAQHCQNPPTENSDNTGEAIIESRVLGLNAEVDDDDDGVHGGRMKPLSSFDANKSIKKLARMPNAVKGKQFSLRVSKENIHVETKDTSSVPQKGIKRKRSSAALRRSRKRVRTIMRDKLACNSIEHSISIDDKYKQQFLQASKITQHVNVLENVEHDIHMDKWRSLFDQMENSLQVEGMQLEGWLRQVKEMQAQYMCGLENIKKCTSNSHGVQEFRVFKGELGNC